MIFVGDGALVSRAIKVAAAKYRVDFVFSGDPNLSGSCHSLGIPFKQTRDINGEAALIAEKVSDRLVWSINNKFIFKKPVLDLGLRIYNIHNGLLPSYRGDPSIAVIFAILAGETESGGTLHEIDAGIDTGAVLAVEKYPIGPKDCYFTVMSRGIAACQRLFEKSLTDVVEDLLRPIQIDPSSEGGRYYDANSLHTLSMFRDNPNFKRATDLGIFADFFPKIANAVASASSSVA